VSRVIAPADWYSHVGVERMTMYRLGHGGELIIWRNWTQVCLSRLRDRRRPWTGG